MSWRITPRTWTIDEFKPSAMSFTVTNNNDVRKLIKIAHSEHFHCYPPLTCMDVGSTKTFFAQYFFTDSSDNLKLEFSDSDREVFPITIKCKSTTENCETKNKEQNSDFLECKICLLKYDEEERAPRMLTCGHTLCSKCAESLWKTQNRQKIHCPFDRTVTTLPNSQFGIKNLPKNFSLLEMLESKKEPAVVEPLINTESFDIPCAENPHHGATVFCTNCELDLCEKCFTITHGSKIFQRHEKLPLREKPVFFSKCIFHPGNIAQYQCKESSCSQPSKVFCRTCLLQEHKGHSYEHLQETALRNQQKLRALIPRMCEKIERLYKVVKIQKRNSASFQPDSAPLLKRRNYLIEQFQQKLQSALEEFDINVKKQKDECQQIWIALTTHSNVALKIKKDIDKTLKSKVELFNIDVVAKRAEDFLNAEFKHCDALDDWNTDLDEKMGFRWKKRKLN